MNALGRPIYFTEQIILAFSFFWGILVYRKPSGLQVWSSEWTSGLQKLTLEKINQGGSLLLGHQSISRRPSGLQGLVFGVDLVDYKAYTSEMINQGRWIPLGASVC
jgi:hypothetical protein